MLSCDPCTELHKTGTEDSDAKGVTAKKAKDPRAGVAQDSGSSTVGMLEGFSRDLALQQCCKELTQFS